MTFRTRKAYKQFREERCTSSSSPLHSTPPDLESRIKGVWGFAILRLVMHAPRHASSQLRTCFYTAVCVSSGPPFEQVSHIRSHPSASVVQLRSGSWKPPYMAEEAEDKGRPKKLNATLCDTILVTGHQYRVNGPKSSGAPSSSRHHMLAALCHLGYCPTATLFSFSMTATIWNKSHARAVPAGLDVLSNNPSV